MSGEKRDSVLFLDWDGTLSRARFWSAVDGALYGNIQRLLFQDNRPLVAEWMRGGRSSEEVCAWLADRTGAGAAELFKALAAGCAAMTVTEEAAGAIGSIRATTRVILVTDNMDCFSRFTLANSQVKGLFDEVVNSAAVGRLKNDDGGWSFLEAASRNGAAVKDCRLIDDSAGTCALLTELGGRAWKTGGVEETTILLRKFAEEIAGGGNQDA